MSKAVDLKLEQVENSKIYVSPNGAIEFKEPMFYLEPFIDKFKNMNIDWTFQGEIGSVNKNKQDEDLEEVQNTAYSSLAVKVKLPSEFDFMANDSMFNKLFSEIGFVYNLEGQKPVMRLYRGSRVSVCTNSCVFGADNVSTIYLTGGRQSLGDLYDKTSKYLDDAMEMVNRYTRIIDKMTSTVHTGENINELFGRMVRLGINNNSLGINPVTGAIKNMLDKKSRYSIQDNSITSWTAYNSVTEELKKSSLLNESSKTLLLEELFVN